MFKLGEIVYHKNLYFSDGQKDNKQNRPCIILDIDSKRKKIITVPLTSNVKSFNKNNHNYVFIPYIVYNYYKLSFVKIDCLMEEDFHNTYKTGMNIDKNTFLKILIKASNNLKNKKYKENIENHIYQICDEEKQAEKEQKRLRKLNRLNHRRQAKNNAN